MPDDEKVEFVACGGAHSALLTQVGVPLSLLTMLVQEHFVWGVGVSQGRKSRLAHVRLPGNLGAFPPRCFCCLLTDGEASVSVTRVVCGAFVVFDTKFTFLRVGSCSLLVLENMGNSVTIQQRMS